MTTVVCSYDFSRQGFRRLEITKTLSKAVDSLVPGSTIRVVLRNTITITDTTENIINRLENHGTDERDIAAAWYKP